MWETLLGLLAIPILLGLFVLGAKVLFGGASDSLRDDEEYVSRQIRRPRR